MLIENFLYTVSNNGFFVFFCLLISIIAFGSLVYYLQKRLLLYETKSFFIKLVKVFVNAIYLPIILYFFLMIVCYRHSYFLKYLEDDVCKYIDKIYTISFIWLSWMFCARIMNNINRILVKDNKNNRKVIFSTFLKILSFIAYFIMCIVILNRLGLTFSSIIALFGGPAIVFGFAGREILANFISGLTMLINNSFKVGDYIVILVPNIEGRVLNIGIKKTAIITLDHMTIDVPNSIFLNSPIINKSRSKNSVVSFDFFIEMENYNKIDTLREKIKQVLSNNKKLNEELGFFIFCKRMDTKLVFDLEVKAFAKTNNYNKVLEIHHDLFVKILDILNNEKVIIQGIKKNNGC